MSPWWKPATAHLDPAPDWRAALESLEAGIAARPVRRLRVVLSNHFTRFLMLPWDETLARGGERRTYAEHHFTQVYGARAAEWSYAIDRFGKGALRLAAAVDRALLDALRALAAKRRFSLAGAQPLLTDAYNRERSAATENPYFFGVLEAGRATLLFVRDGAAERVASRRCGDAPAELERMVAAESASAGLEQPAPLRLADATA